MTAAGGAAIAAGAIFFALGLVHYDDLANTCGASGTCAPEELTAIDRDYWIAGISAGVGLVSPKANLLPIARARVSGRELRTSGSAIRAAVRAPAARRSRVRARAVTRPTSRACATTPEWRQTRLRPHPLGKCACRPSPRRGHQAAHRRVRRRRLAPRNHPRPASPGFVLRHRSPRLRPLPGGHRPGPAERHIRPRPAPRTPDVVKLFIDSAARARSLPRRAPPKRTIRQRRQSCISRAIKRNGPLTMARVRRGGWSRK